MKYTSSNKPPVCLQTQSTCYKETTTMKVLGILLHSTGANNPTLKRYVQPSETKPAEDTYTREQWMKLLGDNPYNNDWNHIYQEAGLNAWIGKYADGSVHSVQTMPWNFRPWGCGTGSKGSCNSGWIQFEICEDALTDKNYFNAVYNEAVELSAYLCKLHNLNPQGTAVCNGVKVPVITCHKEAADYGVAYPHADVLHWFKKYGKTMDDFRADVAKLLNASTPVKTYTLVTSVRTYSSAGDAKARTNPKGTYKAGTYYVYNKYPDGVNGMLNITTDKTGNAAGGWINPADNVKSTTLTKISITPPTTVSYVEGTSLNTAGLTVTAHYSDSTTKKVTDFTVTGYTATKVGTQTITVTYQGMKATFVVTVTKKVDTTKVYDLNYSDKQLIVDTSINRDNTDCVKVIKKILSNNPQFDVDIAKTFFSLASLYSIDPMMAMAQSILETGWFKYQGSAVTADHHNYCGLGVTELGKPGNIFNTVTEGVRAQLQHLYAYGTTASLPNNEAIVDPRFKYVTRGIAPYWQQLAGRWACPGYNTSKYESAKAAMDANDTYGQRIRSIYKQLEAVQVTDDEILQYFPNPDVVPDNDDLLDDIAFVFSWLKKIILALQKLFTQSEE